MIITISGLPGTGTTTVSKILQEHYGMDFRNGGEIFRGLAQERGMTLAEFGALCEADVTVDRLIDEQHKKLSRECDNIILEGRLAGLMAEPPAHVKCIRIWLKAPLETRVRRIMDREGSSSFKFEMNKTMEREESERTRYQKYYNVDINDLTGYDIVLDTEPWNQYGVADILIKAIDLCSGK